MWIIYLWDDWGIGLLKINFIGRYFLRLIQSHSGLSLSSDTNIHLPLSFSQKWAHLRICKNYICNLTWFSYVLFWFNDWYDISRHKQYCPFLTCKKYVLQNIALKWNIIVIITRLKSCLLLPNSNVWLEFLFLVFCITKVSIRTSALVHYGTSNLHCNWSNCNNCTSYAKAISKYK